MALPSSGPISMSMVATEFSVNQSNISLTNLGNQLSTPVTSNISLAASFYGQSAVTLTSISILTYDGGAFGSNSEACDGEEGANQTYYHDGSNSYVVTGDKIYTTNATSNPLGNGHYRQAYGSKATQAITIDGGAGEVSDINTC